MPHDLDKAAAWHAKRRVEEAKAESREARTLEALLWLAPLSWVGFTAWRAGEATTPENILNVSCCLATLSPLLIGLRLPEVRGSAAILAVFAWLCAAAASRAFLMFGGGLTGLLAGVAVGQVAVAIIGYCLLPRRA